jgi:hypothetical protein
MRLKPLARILTAAVIAAFTIPFAAVWIVSYDGARIDKGDTVALDPIQAHFDGRRWTVVERLDDGRLKVRREGSDKTIIVKEGEFTVMDRWNQ